MTFGPVRRLELTRVRLPHVGHDAGDAGLDVGRREPGLDPAVLERDALLAVTLGRHVHTPHVPRQLVVAGELGPAIGDRRTSG